MKMTPGGFDGKPGKVYFRTNPDTDWTHIGYAEDVEITYRKNEPMEMSGFIRDTWPDGWENIGFTTDGGDFTRRKSDKEAMREAMDMMKPLPKLSDYSWTGRYHWHTPQPYARAIDMPISAQSMKYFTDILPKWQTA